MSTSTPGTPDDAPDQVHQLDEHTFSLIFGRYYAPLVEFAARYVRESALAEDVVDDVFARLWEIRTAWRPTTTVRAYLFGAVRNRVLNALRQRSMSPPLGLQADVTHRSSMADTSATPDIALVWAETTQQLREAIEELSQRDRLILRLRWREQLSWEEIANVLETTVAAAQMRHTRTLRLLHERLRHLI